MSIFFFQKFETILYNLICIINYSDSLSTLLLWKAYWIGSEENALTHLYCFFQMWSSVASCSFFSPSIFFYLGLYHFDKRKLSDLLVPFANVIIYLSEIQNPYLILNQKRIERRGRIGAVSFVFCGHYLIYFWNLL